MKVYILTHFTSESDHFGEVIQGVYANLTAAQAAVPSGWEAIDDGKVWYSQDGGYDIVA